MSRSLELGQESVARARVRRLTARQMRFIEYGWKALFREAFFTFGTLFWSFLLSLAIYLAFGGGASDKPNSSAVNAVLIFYLATLIYIPAIAFWQLGMKHYFIPGKSLARFRLSEDQLKKLLTFGSVTCGVMYIIVIILLKTGVARTIVHPSTGGFLGGLGISLYFASRLIKVHGDTDQIASKYIGEQLNSKTGEVLLSFQSFKDQPRRGSRIVGVTNEIVFSAVFNGKEWQTTKIPLSQIKSIGMRAASRKRFSWDQPLYLPSSAAIVIQAEEGSYYKLVIDTTDGFQTNCFLFCKAFLEIIDSHFGAGLTTIDSSKKQLTRRINSPLPTRTVDIMPNVVTAVGRQISIDSPVASDLSSVNILSIPKRTDNRAIII